MNRLAHHQGIHKFFMTLGLALYFSKPVIKHLVPRVLIIQNYTYAFHKFGHTQTKQRPSRISNREEAAQRKNGERTK
ncbi:hypothetical protein ETC03_17570 [Geobacillus sp. MMMUD3]|nr:hypothetical protein [Geobacillus sp. MMMUD3]